MRQILIILIMMFCVCSLVFSQADRNTRYVAVQTTALKSSTGFFSSNLGTLSFGDAVTLVREDGKWSNIRFGNLTGWVETSKLSVRRIITTNSTGVSATEVALAGKGFTAEMEAEYRRSGLDYSMVDSMEQAIVPLDDLLRFINEGHLQKGE
jgi:uncharacterized protein YgiM (DUF1202 family)